MTSPVVVTGASGFLGRKLMRRLSIGGIPAIGFTRQRGRNLAFVADYSDMPVLDGAVLIHLAQGSDTSASYGDTEIDVCRLLSARPWRHIIYASSASVYGDLQNYPRRTEEAPLATNDYVRVKLACEKIVYNVGGTSLRFSNLYGPGMSANTVIADILRQIPGAGHLMLRDLSPVRDFLWIEDAVSCLLSACQKMPGTVLNAGSGRGINIEGLARLALTLAGEGSRQVEGELHSERLSSLTLDIAKTQSILGWSPDIDLSTGLSTLLGGNVDEK